MISICDISTNEKTRKYRITNKNTSEQFLLPNDLVHRLKSWIVFEFVLLPCQVATQLQDNLAILIDNLSSLDPWAEILTSYYHHSLPDWEMLQSSKKTL